MKRRILIHLCLLIIILFHTLGTLNPIAAQSEASCETRAVWLNTYAFKTEAARLNTLQTAQRANLNTLFVLVPPVYDSRGVYHNGWANRDAFTKLLQAAKQRGFRVHGWVANYYRKPSGVDYRYNNEWNHQANWALALLAKYPQLDGIHFDYIRYVPPTPGGDEQNKSKMEAVNKTVRVTFNTIKAKYPNKSLTAAVFNLDPHWTRSNAYVPAWFSKWKKTHPNNRIYRDPKNPRENYGPRMFRVAQDPVRWLNNDYIDGVAPMIYTMNMTIWRKRINLWKSFVGKDDFSKVWFGIAWYYQGSYTINWPDGSKYATANPLLPHNPGAAADAVVKQINYARKQGMKGFVIFEIGGPALGVAKDRVLAEKLRNGPFSQKVPSCLGRSATAYEQPAESVYLPIIR